MKNLDDINDFPITYKKEDFGEDFLWGVSTAAFQTQENHEKFNGEQSFLDEFPSKKNSITF